MWHEARRQEKKIRQVIVDYKKRSERRHYYYERVKQDPTKFMQVHGRKCKIHLDGNVAAEADNNNHMMPWQGDSSNMIDRFDVRTHLDYFREDSKSEAEPVTEEERKCNFERYRVIIWKEYCKISEAQHLQQIAIEEQFSDVPQNQKQRHDAEIQKKMLAQSRANIGYDYEGDVISSGISNKFPALGHGQPGDDLSDDNNEYEFMKELEEIPPLSEISMETITCLDEIGVKKYNLRRGGFGDSLLEDQDYMDKVDEARAIETEKQKMSGRKSRRERRIAKEERLRGREIGRLSYVRQESHENSDSSDKSESDSSSETTSSEDEYQNSKVQYITSFGSDSVGTSASSTKKKSSSPVEYSNGNKKKKRKSRSRERHSSKYYRSGSRSSSPPYESYSRRKKLHDRSYRRSRSRSRSPRYRYERRRSKSPMSKSKSAARALINSASSITLIKAKKVDDIKKLTPQEKLKIKMQRALNRQLKIDRNVDMEKRILKHQERMEREDDLREMSRKMRQKEREERP